MLGGWASGVFVAPMTPNRSVASDEENRAVSPVVGVAILVGITVILASVVGAFVFGLVSIGESSPDASFTFSQETSAFNTTTSGGPNDGDNNVTTIRVTHNSGETIQTDQLFAKVSGNKSEPQSNETVYQIDYNGDDNNDGWHLVLNDSGGENTVVKPGSSFVIGFYGVKKDTIAGDDIADYNPGGVHPPGEKIGFESGGDGVNEESFKIGECDLVEIVWRSDSGAQGQVLQTYQVPGTECA
jgi:flagellin-like protein